MKRKELLNLRNKNITDLSKSVIEKKLELVKVLAEAKVSGDKNVKKGRMLRSDIAKISTIIREKQLFEESQSKA